METSIKAFVTLIISTLLAAFHAIVLPIALYVILFAVDVLMGMLADRIINSRGFSTDKFFKSILLLTCYCIINFIVAAICYFSHSEEYVHGLIKTITVICAVFYAQNIFKNLHKSYPENNFFAFVYWFVSFEIVMKIPYLKKFQEREVREVIEIEIVKE